MDDAGELSALEEISDEEAVSISVPPSIPPMSTSLRNYVDKSETLAKLVQLGNQIIERTIIIYFTSFETRVRTVV